MVEEANVYSLYEYKVFLINVIVFQKLDSFLPKLKDENEKLQQKIQSGEKVSLEDEQSDKPMIEMVSFDKYVNRLIL